MPRIWITTVGRLVALGLIGLAIGWLYGHPALGLLFASFIALAINLVWLYRLDRWLQGEPKPFIPDAAGVWPQVFSKVDYLFVRIKRRGKRFKQLAKQLRQATRAFPEGGIILNAQNEILMMNHAAERLLGLKRKQDRGLRITNLLRNPDFIEYMATGVPGQALEFAAPTNHDQWRSCYLVPFGLDQKLLVIRNITERRKLDQMRRDFVANASHELRTPLTVITGYLDALTDDTSIDSALRQPVEEMGRQAARMRLLVDELLKLSELESKGEDRERRKVDVQALVAAAAQEARAIENCPQDIEIDLQSAAQLHADPADIQSILSNLVTNAVRYTPKQGRITIRWLTDSSGAYLQVQDNGAGIAKEHIPRLTERFYRVENGRERIGGVGGTGLGLAIVKHALQRHGATLQVESKLGEGSTFTCHFPAERIVTVA